MKRGPARSSSRAGDHDRRPAIMRTSTDGMNGRDDDETREDARDDVA
jgi:hypothetical protein